MTERYTEETAGTAERRTQSAEEETRREERRQDPALEESVGWFANTTFRFGVLILGIVLFLFALGQAAGFDLLGATVDAIDAVLSAEATVWLLIAGFALILVLYGVRSRPAR